MNTHLSEALLNGWADGTLDEAGQRDADAHLAGCVACRAEAEALRALVTAARGLPRGIEPERDLWNGIATRLGAGGTGARGAGRPMWRRVALPLAAVLVVALGIALWLTGENGTTWRIAAVEGTSRVGGAPAAADRPLRPGERLETGAGSVELYVGDIGTVEVRQGTAVRLLAATRDEQRLALERGTIEAVITAPPRLFVVETPAAVATDLGCVYTLTVDSVGNGVLHVTSGWVELARDLRVVVVPYDAFALIRPGAGPGTPFVAGAPPALRGALDAFDFGTGGDTAVRHVLAAARPADAVTLMNLLPRTDGELRVAVYERLAGLAPPPPGVGRDAVLALDQRALDRWWDAIRPPRLEREKKKKKFRIGAVASAE